jgi:aminopeptidase N
MKTFLTLICAIPLFCWGQLDFTHLSLKVSFEPEEGRVRGEAELRFGATEPLDSFYLNGIKMEYESVLFEDKPVQYKAEKKGIWIYPDQVNLNTPNHIRIKYSCTPRKGIFFVGWNDPTNRALKQIWTQGQGIDHRHWIPHKDDQTDKLLIQLFVEAESKYQVMANGALQSAIQTDDQTNWHYKMESPMSSYLIALAIGDYGIKETKSATGVPLYQYYYPERVADYPIYYQQNEFIFNQLQSTLEVPFVWQNYKQAPVANFQHGAMENTTATIWGDFFMADSLALPDRNYPYVNAHELAHQWFGNLLTAKSSDHHWLHEGFATYYQWLMEKEVYGQMHFDWERKLAADLVFEASKHDSYPLMNGKAGSYRFYQKGAWVLHMLNQQHPSFDEAIKVYLRKYAFGVVETDDFKAIMELEGQVDLAGFFNFWVKNANDLRCTIRQKKIEEDELILELSSSLNSKGYRPNIRVELVFEDGEQNFIRLQEGINKIELSRPLSYWNANPNLELLMQLVEEKPNTVWERQLRGAYQGPTLSNGKQIIDYGMLDRYKAVSNLNPAESAKALKNVVNNDQEFYAVRAAALSRLMLHDYSTYLPLLHGILGQSNPNTEQIKLQKEAVKMLDDHRAETMNALEKVRFGRSYKLRELAMHKSVLLKLPSANEWLYDERFRKKPGIGGQGVYITALTYRYVIFDDQDALDSLIDRASVSYEFLTRINAIQALQSLNAFNESLLPHLFEGLFNTNRKLLRSARSALKHFAQNSDFKNQIDRYVAKNEDGWDDFQKRMVARTFDDK